MLAVIKLLADSMAPTPDAGCLYRCPLRSLYLWEEGEDSGFAAGACLHRWEVDNHSVAGQV